MLQPWHCSRQSQRALNRQPRHLPQADVMGEGEAGMEIVLGEDEPDIPAAGLLKKFFEM